MRLVIAFVVATTATAHAATIHGLVYDDRNRDNHPDAGEPGIANVVVAFGIDHYVVTDAHGGFAIDVPTGTTGIVWARVPDGFAPGPAFARYDGKLDQVDIALHAIPPHHGSVTFVVASDTHIQSKQQFWNATDLANISADATALEPAPAFFTIMGDVTQGNQDREFDLVDWALANLGVPYVPVAGNHDWYDDGATWFRRYGPDNYSFDVGSVHFVVWNMALSEDQIRWYLGSELSRVDKAMTIVAMTHAPPTPAVIDVLRELHVSYVLTGHTHTNRVIDHDGIIELNTEPMLMGGLDLTPAGYRVVTIDGGKLSSYHRTSIDAPLVSIVSPGRGACLADGDPIIVSTEMDAGDRDVTARVDCATPIALRFAGGWVWSATAPALAPGAHSIVVETTTR
ncbi:MAG TPA: metallophosphoesterase, partial [Kofleriaceae bacterium]|nr:metallophosphoesterase [Kofleriaceae bacterium]